MQDSIINYMLYSKCPICHKKGVPIWRKILSNIFFPAICIYCGTRLTISGWQNIFINIISMLLFPVFIYWAMQERSWYPIYIFSGLLILATIFMKFKPIDNK